MPPKILLVEDNPSDVYLLRRALACQGEPFDLEVALDGERAIEFIRDERKRPKGAHPCVILLDLHLPKYDGFEVLRAIREEPVLSHIHLMVVTTGVSPRQAEELNRLGLTYRLKPKDFSEFERLAADILAICKTPNTLAASSH